MKDHAEEEQWQGGEININDASVILSKLERKYSLNEPKTFIYDELSESL